jgi:hypothetical protein
MSVLYDESTRYREFLRNSKLLLQFCLKLTSRCRAVSCIKSAESLASGMEFDHTVEYNMLIFCHLIRRATILLCRCSGLQYNISIPDGYLYSKENRILVKKNFL